MPMSVRTWRREVPHLHSRTLGTGGTVRRRLASSVTTMGGTRQSAEPAAKRSQNLRSQGALGSKTRCPNRVIIPLSREFSMHRRTLSSLLVIGVLGLVGCGGSPASPTPSSGFALDAAAETAVNAMVAQALSQT